MEFIIDDCRNMLQQFQTLKLRSNSIIGIVLSTKWNLSLPPNDLIIYQGQARKFKWM